MKRIALLLSLVSLGAWSCNTKHERLDQNNQKDETEVVAEDNTAVCIWDKISVRQEPNEKSKWLTSVSLGEKVLFLNETAIDSASKKPYVKIKLSDNTEGWSLADFIVQNGKAAVFLGETEFYKRPDLMTKSGSSFKAMDIVAVSAEQDGWYEVKGKRADGTYISTGWIKPENVSLKDIDIAVAKYASAAMLKKGDEKLKLLKEIIDNNDFSGSYFIPVLRKEALDLEEPVHIEDDEDEDEDEFDDQVNEGLTETLI